MLNLFGKTFAVFESSDSIPVRLIVTNNGKSMLKPQGTIKVKGGFSQEESFTVLPENILAQSSRLLHATPSGTLHTNDVSVLIDGFHMGKYVLTASLNVGSVNSAMRSTVVFYALPFKLFTATIIAIVISIVLIKRISAQEPTTQNNPDAL
ncbi:MAG: hypothetical protein UZ22_OP11002001148 [Microgenomates bacterium OLB23]|nr:MAG: hypothetical protein UZ22_OP11002001148 [Microgenomates bacterium OLB23]